MQSNGLNPFGIVIDLNFGAGIRSAVSSGRQRHEQWTEPVFATHRSLVPARVSPVRATLRRQLPGAEFFLLGPVSHHDVRTVELPGKSARYRRLPALATTPALSFGNSRPDLAQHAGRCQRNARLADLCRFRSGIDRRSAPALSGRGFGGGVGQHHLRARFDHHRSVHRLVSLGLLHAQTARLEAAHAAGPAGKDSGFPAHYAGSRARRQHAGPTGSRSRGFLRDGSRLSQLRTLASLDPTWRFFVTRARKNFRFARLISHPVDKSSGVQCDQTIALRWVYSSKGYPDPLRRIRYWDAQREKRLVFLTNNFVLPASVIAKLYHRRWHVELFFKWIKQHLRIKAFYGTSENAVKTQVWIAVCSYLRSEEH